MPSSISNLQCVFLDVDSLRPQELSLKNLEQQGTEWKFYSMTTADQIAERLKNAEIVVSNKVILGKNELSIARKLKLICVAATGTNNVDLEAAKERGIAVCNVRGYATASVTQHVFGLMISLASNLAAYREAVKKGEWSKSHQFCLLNYPIIELQGKKLGIVGNGVLGKAVSKLASDFGMELLIAESLRLDAPEDKQRVPLDVVFREADFLSLHCPLSEQTQGLINKKNLKKMKPTSFLINTSRGGLIVEEDLVWALETGQIQGAALDVLSVEPPHYNNPLLGLNLPNLLITPHIAWASQDSRQRLVDQIASVLTSYINGPVINRVC